MRKKQGLARVLILVLMEDTHWAVEIPEALAEFNSVLILVLMEDTHWGRNVRNSNRR